MKQELANWSPFKFENGETCHWVNPDRSDQYCFAPAEGWATVKITRDCGLVSYLGETGGEDSAVPFCKSCVREMLQPKMAWGGCG